VSVAVGGVLVRIRPDHRALAAQHSGSWFGRAVHDGHRTDRRVTTLVLRPAGRASDFAPSPTAVARHDR